MTKDLTHGNPLRVILQFTVPILLGVLLQQVYNLVDTMLVGKFVGVDALGGVGSTGSLYFLIIGSSMGLCMGFGIPMANAFGARDMVQLRRYVANCIYLCVVYAVMVTGVVVIFCHQILTAMHTTAETYQYAYDYIYVIFWGLPLVILYNMTAAVIRAVGDSKTPNLFLGLAAALNVGLDLLFILVFDLGVAGAALATNLSQGISGALCLVYIRRRLPELRLQPGEKQFRPGDAVRLLGNGIPMALQYFITSIGVVTLQTATNTLGTTYVNAVAAANKLSQMLATPFDALGTAMATYCGQNTGARKLDRIRSGLLISAGLSLCYSAMYFAIAWFLTPTLSMLFLETSDAGLIALIRQFLVIASACSFALGLVNSFRFSIQGMGYSTLAVTAGILEMVARAGVALLLVPRIGYMGICVGSPCAWIVADFFLVPAAFGCLRRLRKRLPQEA